MLGCTVHTPVTGDLVTSSFLDLAHKYGFPASTLTDNARVCTARFGGGKNAFEYLLAVLGIIQKNGHPGHPQTQGKIERFHQTLKKWLAEQPPTATPPELQTQLDTFRHLYNHQRPHRELHRQTRATTYAALPKAEPTGPHTPSYYRLRYDRVDTNGKMSLRRAGRVHHLGIRAAHTGKRVLAIADDTTITVVHLDTGEVLSSHAIEPNKTYWRNQQRAPGRWPTPH